MLVKQFLSLLEDFLTLDKLSTFLPFFVLELFLLLACFLILILFCGLSCCHQVSNDLRDNTDECQAHVGGKHANNDETKLCIF
jgi:hypothetical protein